ncbi:peptidoglycan-binding protein [Kitasatospora sp. NBC_01302]|uniref:peptidoglycan-binding protein n=1 Tax=Kitasatospora sp. NBC_01302 TaxID=2903575 RepID=UPI002E11F490|nr:HlyD family secretion protein [Kitasatospora sp. NBC_01302]
MAAGTDAARAGTEDATAADPPARRSRRRRVVVTVALVVTVCGIGAGAVGLRGHARPAKAASSSAQVQTVAVVRTDLSNSQTLSGTLGFGTPQTLMGAKQGIITALPAAGTTVTRGQQLYRVNDQPVPLFYGGTPLFRTLDKPGLVGRDVQVVASNLQALGYDVGTQPKVGTVITQPAADPGSGGGAPSPKGGGAPAAPAAGSSTSPSGGPSAPATAGSTGAPAGGPTAPATAPAAGSSTPAAPTQVTVGTGDGVVTTSLIAAVKHWQKDAGLQPTGSLGIGDVVVLPGAIRVGSLQTQLGEQGAEALMSVTPTDKVVTVPVDPANVGSIKQGDKVTVSLPDSSTTPGTVSGIGTAVQGSAKGTSGTGAGLNTPPTVDVTVAVDDPSKVKNFDSATVQVAFVSATATGVLAVPVGSLLALSGGGYAVQLKGGGLVAVQTGMFAKGMVAITGNGIAAGTEVVTTS